MQPQRQTTGWLFVFLVLSSHGIGMAKRIETKHTVDLVQDKMDNPLDWFRRRNPTESEYQRNQDRFAEMSCHELGTEMSAAMEQGNRLLDTRCSTLACSFSADESHEVETLAVTAMRIAAISHTADQKLCLPEVLAAAEHHTFRSSMFRERFLRSAISGEARERFSRAFERMDEERGLIIDLRGSIVDRRPLFPTNVEDPAVCPCQSCTTMQNSWLQAEEALRFKCILNPDDDVPVGEGLHCSEPVLRNSVLHRIRSHFSENIDHQYETWCEVDDWQTLASQTIAISARLTCGAKAIFAPIQTGEDMSADLRATCIAKESGEAVPQAALDELIELDSTVGNVVSPSNLAIFSLLMSVDLISAVGQLRQATRSAQDHHSANAAGEYDSVDFTGAARGTIGSQDVRLAYNHTYTEGSVRQLFGECRRSIFSLSLGLFTGVIQIIIGVAYLATMLALGLLTLLAGGVRMASDFVAELGSSPDQAAVQASSLLGQISDMVWRFGFVGVFTGFTAAFGIWGIHTIFTSMSSPFDCSSGQLGHGPNAVCHPALRYGETFQHSCPGDDSNEITFMCMRNNRGVATFELPRIFGTVTSVETMTNGCAFFASSQEE